MKLLFAMATAAVLCCVLVHAQRQIISIKLTANEVDARHSSKESRSADHVLVDLAAKLRDLGLQPSDYMFNMLFHDAESYTSLTQVRLNRTTGIVQPPLNGFDREVVCDQRQISNVCVDKYIIQVDPKNNDFKHRDTISFDLQITINDVNDHVPIFQSAKVIKNLNEDALIDSLISLPSAVDGDGKFAVQNYELIHTANSAEFFAVELKSRNDEVVPCLRIIKTLDFEQTPKFHMTLIALDTDRQKGELALEINLVDVNDNKPIWSNSAKEPVVVSECNNPRDFDFILQFNATDLDHGIFGKITYKLSDTNPPQVLKTFYIVADKLQLSKPLDYESKQLDNPIMIEIDAKDGGGLISSNVFTIKVTDCNDNTPVLVVSYVNKSVTENDPVEKLVARLVVTDRDSGDNGRVDCLLDDSTKLIMSEDSREKSQSGYLVIYKVWTKMSAFFDRELQSTYQAQVTCSDHGFNSRKGVSNIILNVMDQNDNAPVFRNSFYEFRMFENLPSSTLIGQSITATDLDSGINGQLNYSLDEAGNKYFSMKTVADQRKAGVQLQSKVEFDREQLSKYTFYVIAHDNGHPSHSATATIVVHIDDVNDNPPVFAQVLPYTFNVTETACRVYCNYKTTYIGQVQATDLDTATSISYKLGFSSKFPYELNASILSHFRIEASTGKIYAKKALDRELEATWHLEVIAQDGREPYYSSTAIVTIRVMDINDNRPTFLFPTATNQTLKVDETAASGTLLGFIKATDPDAGENGTVLYKFVNNNESTAMSYFHLDSQSGAITLLQRLDKYKLSHINLLVLAEDNGNPSTRSHLAILKIVIRQQRGPTLTAQNSNKERSNNYPREQAPNSQENSLLPLLLLCGLVFLVFSALLTVLVYMYSRGYISSTCFQERSSRVEEKGAVNSDALHIDGAGWTTIANKNDSNNIVGMPESHNTPHTLRRYHWQAEADEIQNHKISNIDEGVNMARDLNAQGKSISYAYIPVSCDDHFTYSGQNLENGHLVSTAAGVYQTIDPGAASRANKNDHSMKQLLQHKAIINQHLTNSHNSTSLGMGYKIRSAQHNLSTVEPAQPSYPHHNLYDPLKEKYSDRTLNRAHLSPSESVTGHNYTILDANECKQQLRHPMMHIYTDATEHSSVEAALHKKQVKTPYITSSFV